MRCDNCYKEPVVCDECVNKLNLHIKNLEKQLISANSEVDFRGKLASQFAEQLINARKKAETLDKLEEMTHKGYCPALLFDDDGHWTVTLSGIQPMGNMQKDDFCTHFIDYSWHDTIVDAVDEAYTNIIGGIK